MAAIAPNTPEAFSKQVRGTLLKGFAIPVALLAFFAYAPGWLDSKLHEGIATSIENSPTLSAGAKAQRMAQLKNINFEEVSAAPTKGRETLHQQLEAAGITGQFERLHWGFGLSVLLVGILLGVTLTTFVLNRRSQLSRAHLIESYRRAWRLTTAAAIAKIVLLIPLLAYGSFELTTLASGQYFPKLIIFIIVGGILALSRSVRILIKPVPLEFQLKMTRSVTELEAPQLWADVREAAARVGTNPPDNILVGMDQNFFVTELAVVSPGSRNEGRTLYLSYPLIRQLSSQEVTAIVGHELGHFLGDDTRITREFYPMRMRALATIRAMAASGWVGWTSVHSLLFFQWSFARTENETSRQRELEADRIAALLTSPETMGHALVKTHVFTEAFGLALARREANPFDVPMAACVRAELVPKPDYWKRLFEKATPHPLDSHPPLRSRLEALGQPATPETAAAVAVIETESAYGRWFGGLDSLFSGIRSDALKALENVRIAREDYSTEEGRQLLDKNFPEVIWRGRHKLLWLKITFFAVVIALCGLFAAVADGAWPKIAAGLCGALFVVAGSIQWLRHRAGYFTLRADSLNYSGWKRTLVFADVARVSAVTRYGRVTLFFHLKVKGDNIWTYSPLSWMRMGSVSLAANLIAVPQKEVLRTIDRYFFRKAG